MNKIKRGFNKQLMIDTAHFLKKIKRNKKYGRNCSQKMSVKKLSKNKKVWKKYRQNMVKEGKQKKKEYLKEYTKPHSNNVLEKTKENNQLRSAKVAVVTACNKDELESLSNAEVFTNYDYNPEEDKVFGFR